VRPLLYNAPTVRMGILLCLLLIPGCPRQEEGSTDAGPATLGAVFQNPAAVREDGAVILEIEESGPLARAGFRPGDLLLSVNGKRVNGACALDREMNLRIPGDKVELAVRRGTEVLEEKVVVVNAPNLFQKACDLGRASSCFQLGALHVLGRGVEESLQKGMELFARACQGGSAAACAELAGRYADGVVLNVDEAHILNLAKRACDADNAVGCTHLAFFYATGRSVPEDDDRALTLYEKACDGGDAAGCYNVGLHYEKGRGTRSDLTRALDSYTRACNLGNAMGCTNFGYLLEQQRIRPDDIVLAYRTACDGTICGDMDPLGCFNLGVLYRDGYGVEQNKAEAAQLFQRSCDRGNAFGCANLADLYAAGDGVTQDDKEANELYQRACEGGHEGACAYLRGRE